MFFSKILEVDIENILFYTFIALLTIFRSGLMFYTYLTPPKTQIQLVHIVPITNL